MKLEIISVRTAERPVTLRLPFQFGNTEVRRTAEAYAEVAVRVGGETVTGKSAQLMVPRWFDKRAELSNEDTVDELRETVAAASALAQGMTGTVAGLSGDLRGAVPARLPDDLPPLAAGFGPALIEMALIDAACRAAELPFWQAARDDLFGLVAQCPPDLSPDALRDALSGIGAPGRLTIRHTIGFDAPLVRAPGEGPQDGLPVSLQEIMAETGIRAWKIKLKGAPEADLARLRALAEHLDRGPDYAATLDANEQYTPDHFRDLLQGLAQDPALARLRSALRFVEQPFDRAVALQQDARDYDLPLVIDESDGSDGAFAQALAGGWSGTSIKSCKGVLRALVNMARARAAGAILSAEDLTCQPGLCWRQDSAMAAACGVLDAERNGHHFAGGMQGATEAEIAATLGTFPEMFGAGASGRPALKIKGGAVDIRALDRAGFGGSEIVTL
ncbi:enolase C-terminal domain-like protein [Roseisalinus antarcticus]|uniref:Enolase C-terminal domain-containing protein n=1 Tax=Roseisalinus antarcticus TaxID=254357 RepID=A0A1Y5TG05_9RHOB|nr:enolase C-terminal domain-like protein [Roseisalinus antarcticus]SLN61042.1 hypothetical protein ROA7023_02833 [Roseisalinus antarcticus]